MIAISFTAKVLYVVADVNVAILLVVVQRAYSEYVNFTNLSTAEKNKLSTINYFVYRCLPVVNVVVTKFNKLHFCDIFLKLTQVNSTMIIEIPKSYS